MGSWEEAGDRLQALQVNIEPMIDPKVHEENELREWIKAQERPHLIAADALVQTFLEQLRWRPGTTNYEAPYQYYCGGRVVTTRKKGWQYDQHPYNLRVLKNGKWEYIFSSDIERERNIDQWPFSTPYQHDRYGKRLHAGRIGTGPVPGVDGIPELHTDRVGLKGSDLKLNLEHGTLQLMDEEHVTIVKGALACLLKERGIRLPRD